MSNLKVAQTVRRTAHLEEGWTEGATGIESLSFGRVSGLCQLLITVECWHEFSAALQSNKKCQEEQARVLQPPLSVA